MTDEQHRSGEREPRPRPTRAQRIVAAGFLGAFGLTILTVLLTGLWVRAPRSRPGVEPAPPAAVERTEPAAAAAPPAARTSEPASREPGNEANPRSDEPHDPANAAGESEPKPVDGR
jgi:hypothetical protein